MKYYPALFLLLISSWAGAQFETGRTRSSEPAPASDLDLAPGRTDLDPRDGASAGPALLSLAQNINEFGRFADGGSDSNWYVGFNSAWIVKLPPIPAGQEFRRAFIGAKLGRAKARPKPDRPWELSVIPGKIYMAVSQRPSFSSEQSFFLAETDDIPVENDPNTYVPGTGRSEWFWAEVRPGLLSSARSNYLIIWSPARELRDAAHSPILAAADALPGGDEAEIRAWNNQSIQGVPPRGETGALQIPTRIRPALAVKLVPPVEHKLTIPDIASSMSSQDIVLSFSVLGKDIEAGWVEFSQDELEWSRITPLRRGPPFIFTVNRASLPPRGGYLRAKARDWTAVEGSSRNLLITPYGAR